jgi:hypothetical protein
MKKILLPFTILAIASVAILSLEAKDDKKVVTPKSVINLTEKELFDTYPFHLNPAKSATDKKSDVWKITPESLHVIGNGFGYFRTNTPPFLPSPIPSRVPSSAPRKKQIPSNQGEIKLDSPEHGNMYMVVVK